MPESAQLLTDDELGPVTEHPPHLSMIVDPSCAREFLGRHFVVACEQTAQQIAQAEEMRDVGQDEREAQQRNSAFLFPNRGKIAMSLAIVNSPLFGERGKLFSNDLISPSSLLASNALRGHLYGIGTFDTYAADLSHRIATHNLANFGGPANNLRSRMILGDGRTSKLFSLFKGGRNRRGPHVRLDLTRYPRGEILDKEPVWSLLIGDKGKVIFGDYILVTSIPNPFEPTSKIVTTAGRYGAGVRAIDVLLGNPRLVERVQRETKDMIGWQMLARVETQRIDQKLQPIALHDLQIFEISDEFEIISDIIPAGMDNIISLLDHLSLGDSVINIRNKYKNVKFGEFQEQKENKEEYIERKIKNFSEYLSVNSLIVPENHRESVFGFAKERYKSIYLSQPEAANVDRIIEHTISVGREKQTDDANLKRLMGEFIAEAGGVAKAIKLLQGQASPEERAHEEKGMDEHGQAKPTLPTTARILYSERKKEAHLAGTNIVEFLRAEYGPWLDGTLTRPDLRRLDRGAEMALRNWLRNSKLPKDLVLPTRAEVNDELVADGQRVRAAQRLAAAAARRGMSTPNI